MSDRKPMLGDERYATSRSYKDDGTMLRVSSVHHARDLVNQAVAFYESLITTGKLRVVEEVEAPFKQIDMDEWWTCSGCEESFLSYHNPPKFCPGCGNKIKR